MKYIPVNVHSKKYGMFSEFIAALIFTDYELYFSFRRLSFSFCLLRAFLFFFNGYKLVTMTLKPPRRLVRLLYSPFLAMILKVEKQTLRTSASPRCHHSALCALFIPPPPF